MSDDDDLLAAGPQGGRADELLLYDFFKHLTSLSLFTLGGVVAISEGVDRNDVKPIMLIIVLSIISAAGVCSFIGAGAIVGNRYTTGKTQKVDFYRRASPALLAVGVGMFLAIYADSLQ